MKSPLSAHLVPTSLRSPALQAPGAAWRLTDPQAPAIAAFRAKPGELWQPEHGDPPAQQGASGDHPETERIKHVLVSIAPEFVQPRLEQGHSGLPLPAYPWFDSPPRAIRPDRDDRDTERAALALPLAYWSHRKLVTGRSAAVASSRADHQHSPCESSSTVEAPLRLLRPFQLYRRLAAVVPASPRRFHPTVRRVDRTDVCMLC